MTNKVERAIIMAAGLGNRMKPVSEHIPKPLIKVNGKRMIETVIDGLIENGIEDITIVVGYKKEMFSQLLNKYPKLNLISNPYYEQYNNISSLYCAREKLDRACMILDGDQIIYNSKILTPFFEKSGYSAAWVETHTDEWLMQEEGGKVVSCSRTGGEKGWQLYSLSRWTNEDARMLKKCVEIEFVLDNKQIYWDDIPLFLHADEFELGVNQISKKDITEIDSFEELKMIDASYNKYGEEK